MIVDADAVAVEVAAVAAAAELFRIGRYCRDGHIVVDAVVVADVVAV